MARFKATVNGNIPFTEEEEREADAAAAAWAAGEVTRKAIAIREERDKKLSETDWMIIKSLESGIPVSDDYKVYRQALRDVPNQSGFPHNVTWPNKPV